MKRAGSRLARASKLLVAGPQIPSLSFAMACHQLGRNVRVTHDPKHTKRRDRNEPLRGTRESQQLNSLSLRFASTQNKPENLIRTSADAS